MKSFTSTILTFYVGIFLVFGTAGCAHAPIPVKSSPVAVLGTDLTSLTQQATQAFADYKKGDVNLAWAATKGLYAYQTIIKTKDDVKAVVKAWTGNGTFAEKLSRIFAASSATPEAKVQAIATAVGQQAAKQP